MERRTGHTMLTGHVLRGLGLGLAVAWAAIATATTGDTLGRIDGLEWAEAPVAPVGAAPVGLPLAEELDVAGLAAWLTEQRSEAERGAFEAMFADAEAVAGPGGSSPGAADDLSDQFRVSPAVQARLDSAQAQIDRLDDQLLAGDFDPTNLAAALPLGWRQRFGEGDEAVSIALAVTESRLKATHAEVDLVLEVRLPDTERPVIFFAEGIPWSRAGGFTGEVTLELLGDWPIPLARDEGGAAKAMLVLRADAGTPESRARGDGTFVTVTCGEVVAARLTADLVLSRDWVVPVVDGVVGGDGSERVTTGVQFDLSAGGLYATTRFDRPFAFPGRSDLVFEVGEVTVDYSSLRGGGRALVPPGYESPHVKNRVLADSWEGIYIADVSAQLLDGPTGADGDPIGAGAELLIIDETGVTVDAFGAGILPLGKGKLGNWDFSVDTLGVRIVHSNFEAARIAGLVKVPLISQRCAGGKGAAPGGAVTPDECLAYAGALGNGGFRFTLALPPQLCVPAWKSDALALHAGSQVSLGKDDEGAYGQARLHGTIDLDTGGDGLALKTEGLGFRNLQIGTRKPYFSPGQWSAPAVELNLGFLTAHVDGITVVGVDRPDEQRTEAKLSFTLTVDVDEKLDLTAEGGVDILASTTTAPGRSARWRYDGARLGYFAVDASTSFMSLRGMLAFYGQERPDPTWGEGMYGAIDLRIKALEDRGAKDDNPSAPALGIGAVAQFGKRSGERYFLVDVKAYLKAAHIPLFPPLELHGIGGGFYRNMLPEPSFQDLTKAGDGSMAQAAEQFPLHPGGGNPAFLGRTLTGRQYTPTDYDAIGFYVQLNLANPDETLMVGGEIEVSIAPKTAFAMTLRAGVTVVQPGNPSTQKADGTIAGYAEVAILKNEYGTRFTADLAAFVNLPDQVTGIASNPPRGIPTDYVNPAGYAGQLSILISRDEWYFWVGAPANPLAVDVQIVDLTAYLCVGSNVPAMPPLPPEVRALFGRKDRESSASDLAAARGFAFGAEASKRQERVRVKDKWYYDLTAILGFDVNIRNYDATRCVHARGGGAPGFDGWYGMGQVYAYFSIVVWKHKRNKHWKKRADVTAGAALEMRGPNPMWVRGEARGRIEISIIKLKFSAKFEAGDRC